MKAEDPPLLEALAPRKEAVVGEWLARTLRTYPDHTARFLLQDPDPFRNPVGQAFKHGLPALFDELTGAMDAARIHSVLDELVRIRAVQDFTPSQAVGFVFLLKEVLREQGPMPDELEGRIDRLALAAFDLYAECREKITQIRVAEARRAAGAVDRAATGRAPDRPATARAPDRAATVRERLTRGETP